MESQGEEAMSAFKAYFGKRNGFAWPTSGQLPPAPDTNWERIMFETMADYLDERFAEPAISLNLLRESMTTGPKPLLGET